MPYRLVVDGAVKDLGERAYLLSPEDLDASALVPDLVQIGVRSLKIEGRLKGPEYVAAVTSLYRRAVDHAVSGASAELEGERRAALQTFSRGSGPGFLGGIDHQRLVDGRTCDHRGLRVGEVTRIEHARGHAVVRLVLETPLARGDGVLIEGGWAGEGEVGGRIWALTHAGRGEDLEHAPIGSEVTAWLGPDKKLDTVRPGSRVFKTNDPRAERAIAAQVEREPYRVPLDVRVSGAIGGEFVLRAESPRGHAAEVRGAPVLEAREGSGATADVLRDKLGRLGDSPFTLRELTVDLAAGAMIPVSAMNRARRALVEALVAPRSPVAATSQPADGGATRARRDPPPAGLFVLCRNEEQAHAAADAGADGVVLDFLELTGTGAALRALRARERGASLAIVVAPPRIRKPGEEKIDRYLRDLAPDGLLVRSLGALHDAHDDGIARIGDFALNVANRLAAAEILGRGLAAFTPAFDLDGSQLLALLAGPLAPWAEVVVHHPMPLFHMEHCVFAALLSEGRDHRTCGRPCERHAASLQDRAGMQHPLVADVGCRNTVFHAAPQSAVDLVPALVAEGVRRYRIELVREGAAQVAELVRTYRSVITGETRPADARRSLRAGSGYGVVTGSLRVLPSDA